MESVRKRVEKGCRNKGMIAERQREGERGRIERRYIYIYIYMEAHTGREKKVVRVE